MNILYNRLRRPAFFHANKKRGYLPCLSSITMEKPAKSLFYDIRNKENPGKDRKRIRDQKQGALSPLFL